MRVSMTTSPRGRQLRWGLVLVLLAGIGAAGAWWSSALLIARVSSVDLSRVPQRAPDVPLSSDPSWRTHQGYGIALRVPPMLSRRQHSSSELDALIVTDRRQTLWLSVVRRRASWWTPGWYRMCLHARWNPIGLMGKVSLLPPMGHPAPRMIEQRLGPWTGYLYVAHRRIVADLLDGSRHVRAVLVARRDGLLTLELAQTILASIRVAEVR